MWPPSDDACDDAVGGPTSELRRVLVAPTMVLTESICQPATCSSGGPRRAPSGNVLGAASWARSSCQSAMLSRRVRALPGVMEGLRTPEGNGTMPVLAASRTEACHGMFVLRRHPRGLLCLRMSITWECKGSRFHAGITGSDGLEVPDWLGAGRLGPLMGPWDQLQLEFVPANRPRKRVLSYSRVSNRSVSTIRDALAEQRSR